MISFKLLTKNDYALLQKWLNIDFASRWYERRKFIYKDVEKLLSAANKIYVPVISYVAHIDNKPIGYVQTYRLIDYPYFSTCLAITENMAGVDMFIGDKNYLHKGLGKEIIRVFLKKHVF